MATTATQIDAPPRRRVATHPIHGILAAYPLAFFTGTLITDVIYANTAEMQWANFSVWLITGGVIGGLLAAVAGIVDAVANRGTSRRPRRPWPHSLATIVMLVLAIIDGFVHSRDAWTSVMPAGLILSAIVFVLALATSWSGYALEARQEVK